MASQPIPKPESNPTPLDADLQKIDEDFERLRRLNDYIPPDDTPKWIN